MRDYAELVKRLKNCLSDTVEDCAGCPYQGGYKGTYCMNGLITDAADAIEELSKRIDRAIDLYNRNIEKTAIYEALLGISPESPKEEK